MCELFALSSSRPVALTLSLQTLAARGGTSGNSQDGWGVAFYLGSDVSLFREPAAAADSALVRFLETEGPPSNLAIFHIRHATQGGVSLANTQPFVRDLGGCTHVFAHNGDLPGIYRSESMALGLHRPVGQTDSEHAFCVLLARLSELWKASTPPTVETRLLLLAAFAADLRALGSANFLYVDGDTLFAHSHRRFQHTSKHAEPPGLWTQQRHFAPAERGPHDPGEASIDQVDQSLVWIASVPLTDHDWQPMAEGEVMAVRGGEVLSSLQLRAA